MNNYRIVVSYSEDKQTFLAAAPELEYCQAEGATRGEAIAKLEEEMAAQLQNMQSQGLEIPPPLTEADFDGNLTVKVSPTLHRELTFQARADGLELEALLTELLTRGVSQRWTGGRGGRPRQEGRARPHEGTGSRYHNIMENRADFIEYVRSLETGGRGGPGGGGGGGGGRGGGRGGPRGRR